jgi:SOS response regulatory protein OraA/RecX
LSEDAEIDVAELTEKLGDESAPASRLPSDEEAFCVLVDQVARRTGRKRAFALVANRDYTVFEITQRLKWDGYADALVDELVVHLCEMQLLDDKRYTRNFCEGRLLSGFGPYVIIRKLVAKGIEEDDAKAALEVFLDEEGFDLDERAAHLIAKLDLSDPKQKQRAMRKLIARGYDYDCIKRVMARTIE